MVAHLLRSLTLATVMGSSLWQVAVSAQSPPANPQAWTGPRTSDGQPDVQGFWRPVLAGGRSLEDPGVPGGLDDEILRKQGKAKRNPSRVVDPADGKVPYQPWAAALRNDVIENEWDPTRPEHIDTQTRCFPLGVLRQAANANQILQPPGYFILINENYHVFRIIPLDGRPHLGNGIKLWQADSRGRWEGNTLVVESRNFNGKNRLSHEGDFVSENAHVVERFTFADSKTLNYEVTITDPTVFTRPWTMRIPTVRSEQPADYEMWESACHEGERSADLMASDPKK
ncbi:MAG: hypothetical protein HYY76_16720 [Acidobacteria bacterium]|nr:hypothetical protein [Acidobacteriota bacterium]